MANEQAWLDRVIELQSLAQAGLTYGKDPYDLERYARLRALSAEMLSLLADLPPEKITGLFCNESGYQTPKLDTRAAIFEDGKILLVQEANGTWSLPGGWCDVNVSVAENTVKEVKEEAGLDAKVERVIAVQDRQKHNKPRYAYGVCKIFLLCSVSGGGFQENLETLGYAYFSADALPPLAEEKTNEEQLRMCFSAFQAGKRWQTLVD